MMMLDQRAIQEEKTKGNRLYIGGECILMHLTKSKFSSEVLFKFDDFEEQLDEIFYGI